MTFEEYSEKNEKSQNVSGEVALDDSALDAVAGGVGDIKVDTDIDTNVNTSKIVEKETIKIKDDHTDTSVTKKSLISAEGGLSTSGALNM